MTASTAGGYGIEETRLVAGAESSSVVRVEDSDAWKSWATTIGNELTRLINLPEDWDSHGGRPVSKNMALIAAHLLARLGPQFEIPDFFPLSDGGLLLEWESEALEIAIEIRGVSQVSLLIESSPRREVEVNAIGLLPSKLLLEYHRLLVDRVPRRNWATA